MPTLIQEHESAIAPHIATSATTRRHRMPFGAELQEDGRVRFAIWAPGAEHVGLSLAGSGSQPLSLDWGRDGWHTITTDAAHAGSRYCFALPDGTRVPDPASRFQPEDVHQASEVIDPTEYDWQDAEWHGRPWSELVLYELHMGAFTPEGTFLAAIGKLDHLARLGVNAIQVMPIADFAGRRNWGYDGVLLYAPESSYGRPEDFKALIDAAHARGISVMLDVVYNHFGPDGNYLSLYAPQTFTSHHTTPWGDAVNYDDEGSATVRRFVIENVLYWLEEFHLDGLRLDAVHQIKDDSAKHLLDEIAETIRSKDWGRPIHVVLENERNEATRLVRGGSGEPVAYTAQWNDDMHHVLHVAATMESQGYYGDYWADTEKLGRALAQGFAFQGERMECMDCTRGEPSGHLPPTAFVAFMQNHDQIGNRAFGDRINALASPEAVHAIAAIYLLLPQTPMLFMGEEWGTERPFPFFCDFEGDLRDKVREGRRQEFASFPEFQDPAQRNRIPDPGAEETFLSSKLDWDEAGHGPHAEWLEWYQRILRVRRETILPLISQIQGHAGTFRLIGPSAVEVRWMLNNGRELTLKANVSGGSPDDTPEGPSETIWTEGPLQQGDGMGPWSVRWSVRSKRRDLRSDVL